MQHCCTKPIETTTSSFHIRRIMLNFTKKTRKTQLWVVRPYIKTHNQRSHQEWKRTLSIEFDNAVSSADNCEFCSIKTLRCSVLSDISYIQHTATTVSVLTFYAKYLLTFLCRQRYQVAQYCTAVVLIVLTFHTSAFFQPAVL